MNKRNVIQVLCILSLFLFISSCGIRGNLPGLSINASSSIGTSHDFLQSKLNLTGNSPDWIITPEELQYHNIVIDDNGNILPWYNPDNLADSYDHVIHLVFDWWLNIPANPGEPSLPFYLMHRIWRPAPQYYTEEIGGDQLGMAMSSWRLFFDYTGDMRALDDMIQMADHILAHGLSDPTDEWPNLPYPCNVDTLEEYTGDLRWGSGVTQTDKAGSIGYELLNLYKITGNSSYLQTAINIANTLAYHTQPSNDANSPLPYRVNAINGDVVSPYTTNFSALLMLWEGLVDLGQGDIPAYQAAHAIMLDWLQTYPINNGEWGPFFEDIQGWSNTQINAVTMAMYIMEHPDIWGSTWQADARAALDWPLDILINFDWIDYGVFVINEQTAYQAPGNSHTSRQASMELRYAELTGDTTYEENAIRQLSWATYMVDFDGKNRYLNDDIWLTDGYGDYVRHYLRAMAAAPYLAPDDQDHMLRTTSVIQSISYQPSLISYQTFDDASKELLRVNTFIPVMVFAGGEVLPRLSHISDLDQQEGYTLGADGDLPSVLRIRHDNASQIVVTGYSNLMVTPGSLEAVQCADSQASQNLSICNLSDQSLSWSLSEIPPVAWLSETPVSGSLFPDSCQDVIVAFDSSSFGSGIYTSTLEIDSSDPEQPAIQVPVELTVAGSPTNVDFSWEPVAPNVNEDVTFTGLAAGVLPIVYTWDFGDGSTGANQIVNHAYSNWGAYTVSMTAQQCNASTTVSHDLNVVSCGMVINEDFEGTFPPAGWTVENHGLPYGWMRNDQVPDGRPNFAGSDGFAADADVERFGPEATMNTELKSMVFDLSEATTATLQYVASYNWESSGEFANTDISTNGGGSWTNLVHWTSDHDPTGPGELVTIDLTLYVGSPNTMIRFHYYAPEWDMWFEVDQVRLLGCFTPNPEPDIVLNPTNMNQILPRDMTFDRYLNIANRGTASLQWSISEGCGTPVSWLSENPLNGTVSSHANSDVTITFTSLGMDPGTYSTDLCVNSNDPDEPQVVIPVTLTVAPYTATFTYLDLEDVVHSGEAIYLAGSFNGWDPTAIPLIPNADNSIFSTVIGLTDLGEITYQYIVYTETIPTESANWGWLQSQDRSATINGDTSLTDYRAIQPDEYVLARPYSFSTIVGLPSPFIYGQIGAGDLTSRSGSPRGLLAELGYGTQTDPALWTTWQPMMWSSQVGNRDEFVGAITFSNPGNFYFAVRYRVNYGSGNPNDQWIYADRNGGAFDIADAGNASVYLTGADLSVSKAASASAVDPGDTFTYTLEVTNVGPSEATNIVVSDALPSGVTFISTSQGCSEVAGVVICSVSSLEEGDQALFTIVVTAPAQSVILTNTAQVTSDVFDPVLTNNTASVDVLVGFPTVGDHFQYVPLLFLLSGGLSP